MGLITIILGYFFWWLLKQSGHPSTKSWRLRNFFGRLVFITSFLAAGVAMNSKSMGALLVEVPMVWIMLLVVIALPATLIYYAWKVRTA